MNGFGHKNSAATSKTVTRLPLPMSNNTVTTGSTARAVTSRPSLLNETPTTESSIADHVAPKRLEKRVLVVEVDDPAWATQLKFLESQLIATLRDSVGDEVESLEIRVRRSR